MQRTVEVVGQDCRSFVVHLVRQCRGDVRWVEYTVNRQCLGGLDPVAEGTATAVRNEFATVGAFDGEASQLARAVERAVEEAREMLTGN